MGTVKGGKEAPSWAGGGRRKAEPRRGGWGSEAHEGGIPRGQSEEGPRVGSLTSPLPPSLPPRPSQLAAASLGLEGGLPVQRGKEASRGLRLQPGAAPACARPEGCR